MKIYLCCSLAFARNAQEVAMMLEQLGHEVIMPDCLRSASASTAKDQTAFSKQGDLIRSADAFLACNYLRDCIPGYIGATTFADMFLARYFNKPVYTLFPLPEQEYLRDELEAMDIRVLDNNLAAISDASWWVENSAASEGEPDDPIATKAAWQKISETPVDVSPVVIAPGQTTLPNFDMPPAAPAPVAPTFPNAPAPGTSPLPTAPAPTVPTTPTVPPLPKVAPAPSVSTPSVPAPSVFTSVPEHESFLKSKLHQLGSSFAWLRSERPGSDTKTPSSDTKTPGSDTKTPSSDTKTPGNN